MKNKFIELTLPEFAFIEGSWHENGGNPTNGRTIIIHTRSASVIEILLREDLFGLEEGVIRYNFSHFNEETLMEEKYVALLHYCATLDKDLDREMILNEIMRPASKWFSDYCDWEDRQ